MAEQIINVPGVGPVRFPDSMSDGDVTNAVRKLHQDANRNQVTAKAEDYYTPNVFQQPVSTSVKQALTGAAKHVGGMVPATVGFLKDAVTTLGTKNLEDMGGQMQATAAKADEGDKSIPERVLYDVLSRVPVVGPMMVGAGENLGSGNPEQMGAGAVDTGLLLEGGVPSLRNATKTAAKKTAAVVGTKATEVASKVPGGRMAAAAVKKVADNPMSAAVGAYEGYKLAGPGGAVAGAFGLPFGKSALIREILDTAQKMRGGAAAKADSVASTMAQGAKVDPDKSVISGGMSEAGKAAATKAASVKANGGGVLKPRSTRDVATEAVEEMLKGETPESVSLPGEGPARGASMRSTEGLVDSSFKRTGQEPVTVPELPEEPKGVDPVAAAMAKSAGIPETAPMGKPATLQEVVQDELAQLKQKDAEAATAKGPNDVPNDPTAQAIEAERQAGIEEALRKQAGVPAEPAAPVTEPTPVAEPSPVEAAMAKQAGVPEAPAPHRSKSKTARGADHKLSDNDMEVYTANIQKGMTREEATADMRAQSKARHAAIYKQKQAEAAAKKQAAEKPAAAEPDEPVADVETPADVVSEGGRNPYSGKSTSFLAREKAKLEPTQPNYAVHVRQIEAALKDALARDAALAASR